MTIPENNESERTAKEGKTPIFVGIDGKYAGLIAVADIIKENSKESMATLKAVSYTHLTLPTSDLV